MPNLNHCRLGSLIILISATTAAADEATRRRFVAEYPAAARKIEAVYRSLRIDCVTESSNHSNPNNTIRGIHYRYVADGPKLRVDREFSADSGLYANQATSFVHNAEKSFMVDRNETGSTYRVRSVGAGVQTFLPISNLFSPGFSPYCMSEWRVVDLIAKRGFEIEDVVSENMGEEESVVLRWRWLWEGTGPAVRRGEIRFLPGRGWALASYHFRLQLPDKKWQIFELYADVNYQGEFEGVPLVASEENGWKFDDSSKRNLGIYRVTSIGPAAATEKEFTLAAFNLKYDQGIKSRNYGWYLALIGAVGLVGSLAFRRWMNRRRVMSTV